eukprot:360649-Chlamydomonas_euryale.AAC.3
MIKPTSSWLKSDVRFVGCDEGGRAAFSVIVPAALGRAWPMLEHDRCSAVCGSRRAGARATFPASVGLRSDLWSFLAQLCHASRPPRPVMPRVGEQFASHSLLLTSKPVTGRLTVVLSYKDAHWVQGG